MMYSYIKHMTVIPSWNQHNAAFMHMCMLIQVGPHKKKLILVSYPPPFPMMCSYIKHMTVIPSWDQHNAAFIHMCMLIKVGPHKKNFFLDSFPPLN